MIILTDISDSLRTFSKYIPAKPDMKHAANAAPKPRIFDCFAKFGVDFAFSVEDSCTSAIPATSKANAPHCHFFNFRFKTITAKNAVVSNFN